MSASPHEPNSLNADGLFCPECDYNLTGAIERRCPECGAPFDVGELRVLMQSAARPIRRLRLLLRIALPPGLFVLGVWGSAWTSHEWFLGTVWFAAVIAIPLIAIDTADRVFANWMHRAGLSPYSKIRPTRWFVLWGTLLALQATTGCLGAWAAARQVYS